MDRDDDDEMQLAGEANWDDAQDEARGLEGGYTPDEMAVLDELRRKAEGRTSRGPRSYTRSDERIREDICERLFGVTGADASDVTVEARRGEVTLTGTVPEPEDRHRIVRIAAAALGVTGVHDQLRVAGVQAEGAPAAERKPEPVGG